MRRNIKHKLWVSILLIGYIAILCSHAFVMPNKYGEIEVLNTSLVHGIFKDKIARQNTTLKSLQNKNNKQLHLRINKHYETTKFVFILPKSTRLVFFNTILPKPLYYYNNHFVSTFLYIGVGRAPPMV